MESESESEKTIHGNGDVSKIQSSENEEIIRTNDQTKFFYYQNNSILALLNISHDQDIEMIASTSHGSEVRMGDTDTDKEEMIGASNLPKVRFILIIFYSTFLVKRISRRRRYARFLTETQTLPHRDSPRFKRNHLIWD